MTDSVPETQPDPQPEKQSDIPSDAQASSASKKAAAPPQRSPVERAVVWGIIAVLVVVAVLEARSRFGFKAAYDSLLDRIEQGEKTGESLAGLEVTDILNGRKPYKTHEVQGLINGGIRVDIYRFGGILQKRTLYVYYGSGGRKGQPEVVEVTDTKAEKYVPRTTAGSGSTAEKGSGMVDPTTGQPGDGNGAGSRKGPDGEKTKGTPKKKSTTKGTPESKKSKPAPKKSKPESKKSKTAPVKTKSIPPTKKKTKKK